jgi:hypothetical protein
LIHGLADFVDRPEKTIEREGLEEGVGHFKLISFKCKGLIGCGEYNTGPFSRDRRKSNLLISGI